MITVSSTFAANVKSSTMAQRWAGDLNSTHRTRVDSKSHHRHPGRQSQAAASITKDGDVTLATAGDVGGCTYPNLQVRTNLIQTFLSTSQSQ